MKTTHTAEPWQAIGEFVGTRESDYQTIAYTSDHRNRKTRPAAQREEDARRIAACVNALAGISTAEIETCNRDELAAILITLHNEG